MRNSLINIVKWFCRRLTFDGAVSLDALKDHSLMPDQWVALIEKAAA